LGWWGCGFGGGVGGAPMCAALVCLGRGGSDDYDERECKGAAGVGERRGMSASVLARGGGVGFGQAKKLGSSESCTGVPGWWWGDGWWRRRREGWRIGRGSGGGMCGRWEPRGGFEWGGGKGGVWCGGLVGGVGGCGRVWCEGGGRVGWGVGGVGVVGGGRGGRTIDLARRSPECTIASGRVVGGWVGGWGDRRGSREGCVTRQPCQRRIGGLPLTRRGQQDHGRAQKAAWGPSGVEGELRAAVHARSFYGYHGQSVVVGGGKDGVGGGVLCGGGVCGGWGGVGVCCGLSGGGGAWGGV